MAQGRDKQIIVKASNVMYNLNFMMHHLGNIQDYLSALEVRVHCPHS